MEEKQARITKMAIKYSLLFVAIQLLFTQAYYYYGIDFYMTITFLLCRYILKFQSKNKTILDDIFDILYGGAVIRFVAVSGLLGILIYKYSNSPNPVHRRRIHNYLAIELKQPLSKVLIIVTIGFGLLYLSSLLQKEKTTKTNNKQTIVLSTPPKEDKDEDVKKIKIERRRNKNEP